MIYYLLFRFVGRTVQAGCYRFLRSCLSMFFLLVLAFGAYYFIVRPRLDLSGMIRTVSTNVAGWFPRYVCQRDSYNLPDQVCTPGSVVTIDEQALCASKVMVKGLDRMLVIQALAQYGEPNGSVSLIDHLIPVEIGGADDLKNLWPQPSSNYYPKQRLGRWLRDQVCSGRQSLIDAQRAVAANWKLVYKQMTGHLP